MEKRINEVVNRLNKTKTEKDLAVFIAEKEEHDRQQRIKAKDQRKLERQKQDEEEKRRQEEAERRLAIIPIKVTISDH